MTKPTDETLFFLLHVEDAPPIAPNREDSPQTLDHSGLQPLPGLDFESSILIGESACEESDGLGRLLLGSLIAFAAISVISALESVQAGFQNARRLLAGAAKVVAGCARASWVTTSKLRSLRRVPAVIERDERGCRTDDPV